MEPGRHGVLGSMVFRQCVSSGEDLNPLQSLSTIRVSVSLPVQSGAGSSVSKVRARVERESKL